jgi:hypothetical protein
LIRKNFGEKNLPTSPNAVGRLIAEEGFPTGVMVARTRLWPGDQVDAWIASRPSAKSFLRGRAKQLAAKPAAPALPDSSAPQIDLEDLLR